jgi:molecular chaperone HtpG
LKKSDIKEEDYKSFYKHISHDFDEPLIWSHSHIEGKNQYILLLYIPKRAPFDMMNRNVQHGLKLYVQRVYIMDDAEQFLPQYLRFVKGVIDSNDLPLNISRELLQHNSLVDKIKSAVVKKIISMLEELGQNNEQYEIFWQQFGSMIKEGIIEDPINKKELLNLLRFTSTTNNTQKQNISFAEYLKRMPSDQEKIYYITASSYNAALSSPQLEYFKKNNIEVILFYDRIDEWLVSHLDEYEGKKIQSVSRGKLNVSEDKNKIIEDELKKQESEFTSLFEKIKNILGPKIKDVRISSRLVDSPACLVADEHDMGREMLRLLEAAGHKVPETKPILEINANHLLIKKINQEENEAHLSDWVNLIFEQAVLAEGGVLEDPSGFVGRLNKVLLKLSLL